MFTRYAMSSLLVASLSVSASPGTVLPVPASGAPQLRVTAIANQGALRVGANTFRVTVANGSYSDAAERVPVVLEILDPDQVKSEFRTEIRYIGPGQNSNQPAWFRNVTLAKPGPHTITAIVDPNGEFANTKGQYLNDSNKRTQIFTVPGRAEAYRLNIAVKNANNSVANGLRVSIKTQDGQELFWKMTSGNGQADFQKLAPSPMHKPYTIEVRKAANIVHTQTFEMPKQDTILNIRLN